MEWITDEIIVLLLLVVVLILAVEISITRKTKKKSKDVNIEWYGPDICLKKKDYGEIKDDFREKIIEKE